MFPKPFFLLLTHTFLFLYPASQLPISCSHQMAAATREGASTMEGTKMTTGDANTSRTESPGPAKMVGAKKKKYRHELCCKLVFLLTPSL